MKTNWWSFIFRGVGPPGQTDKQVLGARDWSVLVSLTIYYMVWLIRTYVLVVYTGWVCCGRLLIAQSRDTYYYFALLYFGFLALSGRCLWCVCFGFALRNWHSMSLWNVELCGFSLSLFPRGAWQQFYRDICFFTNYVQLFAWLFIIIFLNFFLAHGNKNVLVLKLSGLMYVVDVRKRVSFPWGKWRDKFRKRFKMQMSFE